MSSSLDQTLSSSFVYTSTFPSGTSISSTESTSTRAFGDATVVGTSATAVLACNSIAIVACVFVLVAYVCLYQKHRLLMRRTSLTLSCAMAVSGLLLHVSPFFCPGAGITASTPYLYHSREGSLRYYEGLKLASDPLFPISPAGQYIKLPINRP